MSRALKLSIFLFIIFIFCYFRLKPLYLQTVGYTYDQGRDFLKTAEIILDKNLAFTGPTTGIPGVYHGVWWYYILTVPFILFGGSPIGFYYFNFLLQFLAFIFFIKIIDRYFGTFAALFVALLTATSQYFISISTFVGNNIIVPPIFMLFVLFNLYILDEKKLTSPWLYFILGFLLSLITEFELVFGLYLMPVYFLLLILLQDIRSKLTINKQTVSLFVSGLFLPFLPRILYELKNNFQQTSNFFLYLVEANKLSPHTFHEAVNDRINIFYLYFRGLFFDDLFLLVAIFGGFVIIYFILEFRTKSLGKFFTFNFLLLLLLFIISFLNKDNFFWSNYYEGIQYLFLILIASLISLKTVNKNYIFKVTKISLFIIILTLSTVAIITSLNNHPSSAGTIASHQEIIDYIQTRETNLQNYCVKIYTPPEIPYTYDYLFLYKKISQNVPKPKNDWVRDTCWLVIEPDSNSQRRKEWVENIIHKKKELFGTGYLVNGVEIIRYEK